MNSKQILCEHVNRLLRERNITKSELAEGIDMDKSNLGKMLNGQHPFDLNLLDPIAEFFGVDCEELIASPKMTVKKKERNNGFDYSDTEDRSENDNRPNFRDIIVRNAQLIR